MSPRKLRLRLVTAQARTMLGILGCHFRGNAVVYKESVTPILCMLDHDPSKLCFQHIFFSLVFHIKLCIFLVYILDCLCRVVRRTLRMSPKYLTWLSNMKNIWRLKNCVQRLHDIISLEFSNPLSNHPCKPNWSDRTSNPAQPKRKER